MCVDGPATPGIEAPTIGSAFIKSSVFSGQETGSTNAAAIHQQGALVLFNCSFQGPAPNSSGSSLWVGSAAVSTTVAYCNFGRGHGIQLEAAALLPCSPFQCLGTVAWVVAGPERAPVQGVCFGPDDIRMPHRHLHVHGISKSTAIPLLIAGLLLALAAVVRYEATRPRRRRQQQR